MTHGMSVHFGDERRGAAASGTSASAPLSAEPRPRSAEPAGKFGSGTVTAQLNSRRSAVWAVLCALSLGAILSPQRPASAATIPAGCGQRPSWIESATLPRESQDSLDGCFSSDPPQAEALLSIASTRPYAQLITVSGATLDLAESSFASSLEASFSGLLAGSSAVSRRSAFLLGPGAGPTLAIERPLPGGAHEVLIGRAPANASAVAAVAWTLLRLATEHRWLPTATRSCIATAVYGALSSPPQPEEAFRRIHLCVNAAGLGGHAEKLLRALAGRVLRGRSFERVIHREAADSPHAQMVFTIAPSNPNLIDPAIHLGSASFGSVPAGVRTVEHLSASGGVAPYRFYLVPEPGGPGVPRWLKLAAGGTLVLEPPPGASSVNLPVEVVDSRGEHSVVTY